jgi:acetyltransferase-like isoleucine patch superfamily enzyme
MLAKLLQVAKQERPFLAIFSVVTKLLTQLRGRLLASILGWPQSYLGSGSKIIGTKAIIMGKHAYINKNAWIEAVHQFGSQSFQPSIKIGQGFSAANNLHISSVYSINIGDNCLFGSGVYISDHNHGAYKGDEHSDPSEPPIQRKLASFGAVTIGSNVWFGDNVIVVGPIEIGNGVVIGANTVVTKNIPDNVMVAGAPPKVIKKYNETTKKWERV